MEFLKFFEAPAPPPPKLSLEVLGKANGSVWLRVPEGWPNGQILTRDEVKQLRDYLNRVLNNS